LITKHKRIPKRGKQKSLKSQADAQSRGVPTTAMKRRKRGVKFDEKRGNAGCLLPDPVRKKAGGGGTTKKANVAHYAEGRGRRSG